MIDLQSVSLAQATIDALATQICVLDGNGTILAVNEAWRRFGRDNPPVPNHFFVGEDYLSVCDHASGPNSAEAGPFAAALRDVLGGRRAEFMMEYPCHSPGDRRWFIARVTRFPGAGSPRVVVAHQNITELRLLEEERDLTITVLGLINSGANFRDQMRQVILLLRDFTGCEAVGIRLQDREDFPYFETVGFPASFLEAESSLSGKGRRGELLRDGQGNLILECMCGNILSGRFDPAKPFFSPRGSFWTNSTSVLLATTTDADRLTHTRNRCNIEGYESLALIPVRAVGDTLGLLQFCDRGPDRFTPERIARLERLADHLAPALARRQAEQAQEQSDQFLRLAATAAKFGTYAYDYVTGDGHWSPEFKSLLGLKPHQPLLLDQDLLFTGLHAEDRSSFLAALTAANDPRTDGLLQLDLRIPLPDGLVRWLQVRNLTSFAGQGKARRPDRAAGVVLDITERKQAEEELRHSREALRALTARMNRVREEERARLALEIHDELGHVMTDLRLDLAWLSRRLAEAGIPGRSPIRKRITAMSRRAEAGAETVRRIATELRPAVLDALGLAAAIEWQTREFQQRTRIECEVETPGALPPLDASQSTEMFRIFQESLNNVARHARAARVQVRLTEQPGRLDLRVSDNGRGITEAEQSNPNSLGLLGMRERATALGGEVSIESVPGHGTTITVSIPI